MTTPNDHQQAREAEKARALAGIGSALQSIEQQHREPDMWERDCLAHALSATFSGCYGLAVAEAQLTMTPPAERSPTVITPREPAFARCDLGVLKRALRAAQTEPVREFPNFGPIVLV